MRGQDVWYEEKERLTYVCECVQQWEKARQMCDEALKINPTYIKALQQRARAYTKLTMFDKARSGVPLPTEDG